MGKSKNEAIELAEEKQREIQPHFYGFDLDHRVLKKAQKKCTKLQVPHLIKWQADVAALKNPRLNEVRYGYL